MTTLFDEVEIREYKGVTTEQYNKAILDYSDAMFKLFESDKKYGSSNIGLHIMWLGSWTTKFIARDVVDYSIENNLPLNISLVEVLKKDNSYGNNDLDKLQELLK